MSSRKRYGPGGVSAYVARNRIEGHSQWLFHLMLSRVGRGAQARNKPLLEWCSPKNWWSKEADNARKYWGYRDHFRFWTKREGECSRAKR